MCVDALRDWRFPSPRGPPNTPLFGYWEFGYWGKANYPVFTGIEDMPSDIVFGVSEGNVVIVRFIYLIVIRFFGLVHPRYPLGSI